MNQIDSFMMPTNNDREHEQVVLSGMLHSMLNVSTAVGLLTDTDFEFLAHQLLFRSIIEIWEKTDINQPHVDIGIVYEHLLREGKLEDVGGKDYLFDVLEADRFGMFLESRAELVKDRSFRKALVRSAQEIISEAITRRGSTEDLVGKCQSEVLSLGSTTNASVVSAEHAVQQIFAVIDKASVGEIATESIMSGLVDLDELTYGFHPGELCVIAARPSVGKTALALQIGLNAASNTCPVLFFSLEQSYLELVSRLLCAKSGVKSQFLRRTCLNADQTRQLRDAGMEISKLPIYIQDSAMIRCRNIAATSRRLKVSADIKLLIVDYMQLITPDDSRANRVEQVSQMSRSLKLIARDLGVPVICLAQLNRNPEHRADGKPKMSDLRDSGSIEQDADTVILLHRPSESQNHETQEIVAIVEKQRNGPTGEVSLAFRRSTMRFENAAIGV